MIKNENTGKWLPAACWHNCGGRCLLRAWVEDGVVRKIKTDDTQDDTPEAPQQRACQRGRSQRMQVYGEDRIRYPMKRKHWMPGSPQGELRGRDEWERISWEEAYRLIAEELRRLYREYGPESILSLDEDDMSKIFRLLGGHLQRWGYVSWGAWPEAYRMIMGSDDYKTDGLDRMSLKKQKLIILWGANPAVSSAGLPEWNYLQAKKAGARFIFIDPRLNESIRPLNAEWIPIRPATDTAMILAMIYHIVSSGLHDIEYLERYTVGFDREHMPSARKEPFCFRPLEREPFVYQAETPDPDENFLDYILSRGIYAGEPLKTPEWAEEICGVPAGKIRELAELYAGTKPAAIISGGAPARIREGENYAHALLTLGMICGQIGREAAVCMVMNKQGSDGGPELVLPGSSGVKDHVPANPFSKESFGINSGEIWTAVLDGEYTLQKGVRKKVNIRMLYQGLGGALNQRQGTKKGIEAYRKVDFALNLNYLMTPSAAYSDIVLPVTTAWEREGSLLGGKRDSLFYGAHLIEPMYEAKSNQEISAGIAEALGFSREDLYDIGERQQLFNRLAGTRYRREDGSLGLLLTITPEDIRRWGVKGELQNGVVSLSEFEEKGYYQIHRRPDDGYTFVPFRDFIEDPIRNPVATASGKFEIHCGALSAYIEQLGFSHKAALPVYTAIPDGFEDSRKGEYPFQITNYHTERRAHQVFDNIGWLREAFPNGVWIHRRDAEALGLQQGSPVLITTAAGSCVRPAFVTERIHPGTVAISEGAWTELNEKDIDLSGSPNILTSAVPTGQGNSGFNSTLCRIEKYEGKFLPDYLREAGPLFSGETHGEPANPAARSETRTFGQRLSEKTGAGNTHQPSAKKIVFDESSCTGCHACDIACLDWKDIQELGIHPRRIEVTEKGTYPDVSIRIRNLSCLQCRKPSCAQACRTEAITRNEEWDVVRINTDRCTGCGDCIEACPQGAIFLQKKADGSSTAVKCDKCFERIAEGELPVCTEACPMRVLRFE